MQEELFSRMRRVEYRLKVLELLGIQAVYDSLTQFTVVEQAVIVRSYIKRIRHETSPWSKPWIMYWIDHNSHIVSFDGKSNAFSQQVEKLAIAYEDQ